MSKTEKYKQDLTRLFDEFLKKDNKGKIVGYLVSNSNLPGPRGNLELAQAFAQTAQDVSKRELEKTWNLCFQLTEISPNEAPVNNPREFVPFCGTVALGAIGAVTPRFLDKALARLHELASDPRWRMREAVAMGLQKLLAKQAQKTLKALEAWIENNEWLSMRAVAAGVAEPSVLKNKEIAKIALVLHKKILAKMLSSSERRSEQFKTLRQALGYSLSVVVCVVSEDGFQYMRRLVDSQDPDVLWIVKENLKKNRLVKNFPDEVATLKKTVGLAA